uniref:Uncharacterized protein n=1 Tax=Phylloscopus fuscatus densovirus TaxID=2794500 RepID=A0A8A4XD64_9VIRU|nr:MAG: hypothetical protein [Phylloscopus fuscatus densovirus]
MSMRISNEPCTLVYTLMNPEVINFDDFSLLIRGAHSYQVDSITPHPDMNNVHVKLNYQASIANAQAKLGSLASVVSVSKLSSFVQEDEFSRLEQLRRRFNITNSPGYTDDGSSSTIPQSRIRVRGRGRGGAKTFAPRPAPYQTPKRLYIPTTIDLDEERTEDQPFEFSSDTPQEI